MTYLRGARIALAASAINAAALVNTPNPASALLAVLLFGLGSVCCVQIHDD